MSWVKEFMEKARSGASPNTAARSWRDRLNLVQLDLESYVYFVQDGTGGPVKIGFSANPIKHIGDLQVANPRSLNLLAVVRGGMPLEQALHAILAADRMSGEWFRATPKVEEVILEVIKRDRARSRRS